MYHRFRYKIVSPRCDGPSWICSLPKRITGLRLGDTVELGTQLLWKNQMDISLKQVVTEM